MTKQKKQKKTQIIKADKIPFIYGSALKAYESKNKPFSNAKDIIYENENSSRIFENNGKELEEASIVKLLNYIENIDVDEINKNLPQRYNLTQDNNSAAINGNMDSKTFLMPIQFVHNITGVGLIVIGKVISGQLQNSDKIDILGMKTLESKISLEANKANKSNKSGKGKSGKQKLSTKDMADSVEHLMDNEQIVSGHVSSLKLFNKPIKYSIARDYLGINISLSTSDIRIKDIKRGMVICKQSENAKTENEMIRAAFRFYCKMTLFNVDYQGIGRSTPIHSGFKPLFYFLTSDITGEIDLPQQVNDVMMPGDTIENVKVTLMNSALVWKGLEFIVRESNHTIGVGTITSVG